jgi:hypothetical protein
MNLGLVTLFSSLSYAVVLFGIWLTQNGFVSIRTFWAWRERVLCFSLLVLMPNANTIFVFFEAYKDEHRKVTDKFWRATRDKRFEYSVKTVHEKVHYNFGNRNPSSK